LLALARSLLLGFRHRPDLDLLIGVLPVYGDHLSRIVRDLDHLEAHLELAFVELTCERVDLLFDLSDLHAVDRRHVALFFLELLEFKLALNVLVVHSRPILGAHRLLLGVVELRHRHPPSALGSVVSSEVVSGLAANRRAARFAPLRRCAPIDRARWRR
jgi:hypothetical protein